MTLLQQTKKMALVLNPPFFFVTLALSFTLSFLLPHATAITSSEFSTTVLDVTASLHQAHQLLSFNPKALQQQTQPTTPTSSSSSSSFSLPLHPIESLLNAHHNDYQSLLLSRLDRDSARVNSIITKLQFNNSDLHSTETELRPEDLSAPVTSGAVKGSGEYFTRIGVGQPAELFYIVLDTGSDVNWIQCKPCSHCYQQSDPIFDPSKSSSYSPLTCESQQCHELETESCSGDKCQYKVLYGDGSSTAGDFVTETVSFGTTGSVNRVAMGCGHDNQGLFVGSAGILGLGGGPLSLTSQIKATSFSYCLVDRNSLKSSTLELNSPRPGDSVTAQLLKNPKLRSFYYVGFTGVSVGGQNVPVPPSTFAFDRTGLGGMVVDSGTAVTRLQIQAYNSVRDVFVSFTRNFKRARGPALFDTCYDFSGRTTVIVPTVSFQMSDGKSWTLPAKNYLISVDRNGTFCFALAPSKVPLSILGNVQQQGTRVSFDLANSIVGFSPNKC